jgi:hypothetical protein
MVTSTIRPTILAWLLDSDPAIRWQVLRDLTGAPAEVVAAERARVASEGWGAELLGLQAKTGQWGAADDAGWMTTMDALALLRELGADPNDASVQRAIALVREKITWHQLDGRPFFEGETEACINGSILASGAYFGAPCEVLLKRLLSEQLDDGGWNCEAPNSRRSSFHSTICVLEGLLEHETANGPSAAVAKARRRGEEYLLSRRMFRSLTTGEVIDKRWERFAFPTWWHYDVLRGLDYLRSAGAKPDERMADAVDVVLARAHQNKRWPLNVVHDSKVTLAMEPGKGKASRWVTLRALRVLDWYQGHA